MFIENTLYTKSQIQDTSTNTIHSCDNVGEFLEISHDHHSKEECVRRNYALHCSVHTSKSSRNISQYHDDDDDDDDDDDNNNNNNNSALNNPIFKKKEGARC